MRRVDARLLLGVLLVAGGTLYLLNNLGLITWAPLVWAFVAGAAGLAFIYLFVRDRHAWWLLIPGMVLSAVAVEAGLSYAAPALADAWGGSVMLASLGLAFVILYLVNRQNWWALIPGGVLLSLAVTAGVENVAGLEAGGVFVLGMGATFLIVALAPAPVRRNTWAFVPAAGLGLIGLLLLVGFGRAAAYVWPAVLIVVGLVLLTRSLRRNA